MWTTYIHEKKIQQPRVLDISMKDFKKLIV